MSIHVLFLAAEAEPFVKIGGLADVAGSLPVSIQQISQSFGASDRVDIRMALPFHTAIKQNGFSPKYLGKFHILRGQQELPCQVYQSSNAGMLVYFLDGPPLAGKTAVYSPHSNQDGEKFVFFSLAALKLPEFLDWRVDILHTNDWHTAPAIIALKTQRCASGMLSNTKTLHTLHNLPFMGNNNENAMMAYDLPPGDDPNLPDWARLSPLPLGLSLADKIIAVSPNYAKEIMTEKLGCGLESFLIKRKSVISGILNGIDTDAWNPETDPLISQAFTHKNLHERLFNKRSLFRRFNLPEMKGVPLLTFISRMDPQKGLDIALQGLEQCQSQPWQVIILGTGDSIVEDLACEFERKYPQRVRTFIEFNNQLAHQLYAGADILLMPSRYEPCGLAQMIAMRYGCVPLAHSTGGLLDTIISVVKDPNLGAGFLFEEDTPSQFSSSLKLAIKCYQEPQKWQQIQHNGMKTDFSWRKSALKYIHEYQALVNTSV